jgi:hypothetical protein
MSFVYWAREITLGAGAEIFLDPVDRARSRLEESRLGIAGHGRSSIHSPEARLKPHYAYPFNDRGIVYSNKGEYAFLNVIKSRARARGRSRVRSSNRRFCQGQSHVRSEPRKALRRPRQLPPINVATNAPWAVISSRKGKEW